MKCYIYNRRAPFQWKDRIQHNFKSAHFTTRNIENEKRKFKTKQLTETMQNSFSNRQLTGNTSTKPPNQKALHCKIGEFDNNECMNFPAIFSGY